MENKIYAVKRMDKWWAAIDCGETKHGGMTVGNFWSTHFKHEGRTYRWHEQLFNPPEDLKEWQEINIKDKRVCMLSEDYGIQFEGWEDGDDLCYKTLANFAELIGHPMTIDEVKEVLNTSKS